MQLKLCERFYVGTSFTFESHYHHDNIKPCIILFYCVELPWTKAALQNEEYELWKTNKRECLKKTPWSKIDITAVLLIEKILLSSPKKRCTIQAIKAHRWYNQPCSLSASKLFRSFYRILSNK